MKIQYLSKLIFFLKSLSLPKPTFSGICIIYLHLSNKFSYPYAGEQICLRASHKPLVLIKYFTRSESLLSCPVAVSPIVYACIEMERLAVTNTA